MEPSRSSLPGGLAWLSWLALLPAPPALAQGFFGAGPSGSRLLLAVMLAAGIPALIVAMLLGALVARLAAGRARAMLGAGCGAAVAVVLPFLLSDDWLHDRRKLTTFLIVSATLAGLGAFFLGLVQAMRRVQARRRQERPGSLPGPVRQD